MIRALIAATLLALTAVQVTVAQAQPDGRTLACDCDGCIC